VLAAADFFTVEVWGLRGLVTFYVFFVIELESRKIEIAGITPGPNEAWMMQIGRNLTDPIDGFLTGKEHLILGRVGNWRGDPQAGGVTVADGFRQLPVPQSRP
jgi:hypothetical protein